MAEIINFGGSVSTEAGSVILDGDAAISGTETLLSLTVSMAGFDGTNIYDFFSVQEVGGITLDLSGDNPQLRYDGNIIGHIGSDEAGELFISFDGYENVTNGAVTAVLRAIAYTNTSSANPNVEERTVRVSLAFGDSGAPDISSSEVNVLVRPGNAIVLTAGHNNGVVTGTAGDDVFVVSSSTILQDVGLIGDGGQDAIHFVGGGTLSLGVFSPFSGIEKLRGSAEADTFSISSTHLFGLMEIDGGLGDDTADVIQLLGNYFNFRGKALSGIDTIELMGGASPVFVFDSSNVGTAFAPEGQGLRCLINLGTNGANSVLRLSGGLLDEDQRNALVAAGFDETNIFDMSATPSIPAPATMGLDGDRVGVAPSATVLLDSAQDFSVAYGDVIRKVEVKIPDSASGDLLGIQIGGEIELGSYGFHQGGTIQIGIAQGILTAVGPNHIEVTFLSGGSADAAETLVQAMTYTRPAGTTFDAREVEVRVIDDFDRSNTSNVTIYGTISTTPTDPTTPTNPDPTMPTTPTTPAPQPPDLVLVGTSRADRLTGGDGNDRICGKDGKDVLTGGAGKDIFVFDTKPNKRANVDKITDYKALDDTLWLDNKYFKKLGKGLPSKPGALNKKFFKVADKAKDGNDYLVYNKKTGILSYDADGSGAAKAVEIAKLSKNLKMTAADVFII